MTDYTQGLTDNNTLTDNLSKQTNKTIVDISLDYLNVNSLESTPTGTYITPDGLKLYVLGNTNKTVYQYTLSIAWLLSSAIYTGKSFYVGTQDNAVLKIYLSSDGTKMYINGTQHDKIYQYTLSTPYDVSTASYASKSFLFQTQDHLPYGFTFRDDGLKLYMAGSNGDKIYQYSLGTAWNLSTVSYDSKSFSVGSQDTVTFGVRFSTDGTKMFVLGLTNKIVSQYTLGTAWDVSTASYDSIQFSLTSLDTSPSDIIFNSLGSQLFSVGNTNNTIFKYHMVNIWDISEMLPNRLHTLYYNDLLIKDTQKNIGQTITSTDLLVKDITRSLIENSYWTKITIDNSAGSAQTDYQVKINITAADTHFWSNYNSQNTIRFLDSAAKTYLNYYIESFDVGTSTATIWVKIPSLSTSATYTIYMYYGKGNFSSYNSGTNTFTLFDDFSSGTIDSGKWYTAGSVTVVGGVAEIMKSGANGYLRSKTNYSVNHIMEVNMKVDSSIDSAHGFGFGGTSFTFSTPKNFVGYWQAGSSTITYKSTVETQKGTNTNTTRKTSYTKLRFERNNGTNNLFYQDDVYVDNHNTNVTALDEPINIYSQDDTYKIYVDWVRVRKYQTTEPTATITAITGGNNGGIVLSDTLTINKLLISNKTEQLVISDNLTKKTTRTLKDNVSLVETIKKKPIKNLKDNVTLTQNIIKDTRKHFFGTDDYTIININNSGGASQTNYQVKISLTSSQSDFWSNYSAQSTIHFRDSDNSTELNYWIQDFDVGTSTATIWVKIPSLSTSASYTIYLYYGGTADFSAYNNGDNVFTFFDDFSGTSIDTAKWTVSGSATVSSGILNITNGTLTSKTTFDTNLTFESKFYHSAATLLTSRSLRHGFFYSASEMAYYDRITAVGGTNLCRVKTQWPTGADTKTVSEVTAYKKFKIERNGVTNVKYYFDDILEDTQTSGTYTHTLPISLYANNIDVEMFVDYVFIRTYQTTEPTVTVTTTQGNHYSINLSDTLTTQGTFYRTLTETVSFSDRAVVPGRKQFYENINLTENMNKKIYKNLSETLSFTEDFGNEYIENYYETILLSDTLAKKTNKSYSNTISFSESMNKIIYKSLKETVSFVETEDDVKVYSEISTTLSVSNLKAVRFYINTVNYTNRVYNLNAKVEHKNIGYFEADLVGLSTADLLNVAINKQFVIYINGHVPYWGKIETMEPTNSYTYHITGNGYVESILYNLVVNPTASSSTTAYGRSQYDNKSSSTIIGELLSGSGVTLGVDGTYTYHNITIRSDFDNKLSLINGCADLADVIWYPNYTTLTKTGGGTTSTVTLTGPKLYFVPNSYLTSGGPTVGLYTKNPKVGWTLTNTVKATSMKKKEDIEQCWNSVYALGYGDGTNQLWSRMFDSTNERTYLTASLTATGTTATVANGSLLPASGYVWIGAERCAFTKVVNTLTLTRATADGSVTIGGTSYSYKKAYAHRAGIYVQNAQYGELNYKAGVSCSIETYGLKQHTVTDVRIIDQDSLDYFCQSVFNNHRTPPGRIEVVTRSPYDGFLEDMPINMVYSLYDLTSGTDGNYNLYSKTYTYQSGYFYVTYEFSDVQYELMKQLRDTKQTTDRLSNYMQGSTNIYQVNNAENCDSTHPLYINFYIPAETVAINSVKTNFKLQNYRAYETTTENTSTINQDAFGYNIASDYYGTPMPYLKPRLSGGGSYTYSTPHYISASIPGQDSGSFYKTKAQILLINNYNTSRTFNYELRLNGTSGTLLTSGSESLGAWSGINIAYETDVDYTGQYFYLVLTSPNFNSTTSPDMSDIELYIYTLGTSTTSHSHAITYGIYEETLTSPSVTLAISKDGGAYSTIGTYTTDQKNISLSTYVNEKNKWYTLRFTPNKRMRIEDNTYIQIFINSA